MAVTIQPGVAACTSGAGVTCQSGMPIYDCAGGVHGYVTCQCPKGQWVCNTPSPLNCVDAAPPPATCPDPATLVEGNACSSSGLSCKGHPTSCDGATFYDALQCNGLLFITIAATVCPNDGGPMQTCTGCIDQFGMCSDGRGDTACGNGGEPCVSCTATGRTCLPGGICGFSDSPADAAAD